MPTYKNNTDHTIYMGITAFAPGEEKKIPVYAPDELGLTLTSAADTPVSQVLLAQQVTLAASGSADFVVPSCRKFSLSVVTEGSGLATVTIGNKTVSVDASIGLSLSGLKWGYNAKFSIASTAGSIVNILAVEE
jgi:hypothetical protein